MNIVDNILIVTLGKNLDEKRLLDIQGDILTSLTNQQINGVLLDLSAVKILDTVLTNKIVDLSQMIKLMGSNSIVTGIRPEVIAALIQLGFSTENLTGALNVERGIELMGEMLHSEDETISMEEIEELGTEGYSDNQVLDENE